MRPETPMTLSRLEHEAREALLRRREALARERVASTAQVESGAPWHDWESQGEVVQAQQRRELCQIEEALERIEQGRYGRCVACGGPMGLQRLRALPEARYCLACSGQVES